MTYLVLAALASGVDCACSCLTLSAAAILPLDYANTQYEFYMDHHAHMCTCVHGHDSLCTLMHQSVLMHTVVKDYTNKWRICHFISIMCSRFHNCAVSFYFIFVHCQPSYITLSISAHWTASALQLPNWKQITAIKKLCAAQIKLDCHGMLKGTDWQPIVMQHSMWHFINCCEIITQVEDSHIIKDKLSKYYNMFFYGYRLF